uniref:GCP_C_terminal domain-containing protein n=1 Tax=Heterorhabditis bacteriophora TaxID=37862 RepID=A0A1I7XNT7_HETBA
MSPTHWKSVRSKLVAQRFAFLGSFPSSHWYKPLTSEFITLLNVSPEEQERIIDEEVKFFLAGYQTENIRFTYDTSKEPIGLKINPSLDPYMRSAIDRFKDVFINLYIIRTYCYQMKHDRSFSLIARVVAKEVCDRTNKLLRPIIESELSDNNLLGGQVLSELYALRQKAVVQKDLENINGIFMVSNYRGTLVQESKFMIWSKKGISPSDATKIEDSMMIRSESSQHILIEDLCPSFLLPILQSIVKCGDYRCMMDKAAIGRGPMPSSEDWGLLDINAVARKVKQVESETSAALLKQLRSSIALDNAIKDTQWLLLDGAWVRSLLLVCQRESLLNRPASEVSKKQLNWISDKILKPIAQKHFPFVKNFSLAISDVDVFEQLRTSGLISERHESSIEKSEPLLCELLTLSYCCPAEMEKIIPNHIVQLYVIVFRLLLQLCNASDDVCDALFDQGRFRDPEPVQRAQCYLLCAIDRDLQKLRSTLLDAVDRAKENFYKQIEKVCYSISNETGIYDCTNTHSKAAKEQRIHSTANKIMLIASISMCITGVLSSGIIGYISDWKSRKLALLIPFMGLLIADITLFMQAYFVELSPFYFIVSELIFGCFGGYMSIISSAFAYITSAAESNALMRSKSIARLEGIMGIGGTSHILFFYLKQRFYWDAEYFGYLKAIIQACSTIMALFIYPFLKSKGVHDTCLTLLGLTARALGKAWLVIAWSGCSVFFSVLFEMFSRFPATGLRSLIASNVRPNHRGGAFAMIGVLEGGCNLAAAFVFHSLFPWSLSFMPQLSFIIMAVLIVPPTILIWLVFLNLVYQYYKGTIKRYYRHQLDSPSLQNEYSMSGEVEHLKQIS